MKLDLDATLRTIDGKPFQRVKPGSRPTVNPDGSILSAELEDWTPTLKEAIFGALTGSHRGDADMPLEAKMKLHKLAIRLHGCSGVSEFELDDVTLIKDRANKVYPGIQFLGAIAVLLEGVKDAK